MNLSLLLILEACGLKGAQYEPVHGGDINQCWRITHNDLRYFLKINDAAAYPRMFEKEANGLMALKRATDSIQHTSITVPAVNRHGQVEESQFLLLEWIEKGTPIRNFWESFGCTLASMHKLFHPFFGWTADNYIGNLPQVNANRATWSEFYSECRIDPLVKQLVDQGSFSKADLRAAERFYQRLPGLFPEEPPSLLHGDLWAGNFMVMANGHASIFDPAVYGGHREMDLGMSRLFGGFDRSFYSAYHHCYPLEQGWEHRIPLTQLYPLLVHAILFGGHYVNRSRNILLDFS